MNLLDIDPLFWERTELQDVLAQGDASRCLLLDIGNSIEVREYISL